MFGSGSKMANLMEIQHQMSVGIIYGLIPSCLAALAALAA